MSEKSKIVIPTKSFVMHKALKEELMTDYVPIPSSVPTGFISHTPSKTISLYNSIARAGYFRPKTPQASEPQIRPTKIYPNYMKRDPREYPPIHCCPWRPKSTTGEVDSIQPVLPRTKFVHHTIFDAGKYGNGADIPTVKAINKTVFGNTITTPINLLSTDSAQMDAIPKQTLETEEFDQEDNILQASGITSFSKVISPLSSKGFDGTRDFRRTFKGDPVKAEKYRERFENTQKDFRKIQVRIDELARKKRGWYQENMHETSEVKDKIKEGSLLLRTMDSSHHREEMRHAVRMSAVHAHYEKNWKRLGLKSVDKKEKEESIRPGTTSKLRHLLGEAKQELRHVINSTPDLLNKRRENLLTE